MKASEFYPNFTELRRVPANFELRKVGTQVSSSPGTLTGYAVKWNSLSEDLGNFREQVAPHAFQRSLANGDDVRALINHSPDLIIGRTKNSTLRLSEDSVGLHFEVDVAPTLYGRDLVASVKRGDLNQCSFAFQVSDQDWDKTTDPDTNEEVPLRTIRGAKLLDVSCVTYPAYTSSSVAARDDDNPFDNANPWNDDDTDESEFDSLRTLWPCGVPVELRSHVPNLRAIRAVSTFDGVAERRRRLLSLL